jgi:hypothetical protein
VKFFKKKHIIIILLSVFVFSSCRTKKTFNGTATLPCTDYNADISEGKENKNTKWRLVLYKDGKKIGGKSKKGKSRLFKKKN